jgi:hypothetical protein
MIQKNLKNVYDECLRNNMDALATFQEKIKITPQKYSDITINGYFENQSRLNNVYEHLKSKNI